MYVVNAPLAADHDRQPGGECRIVVERAVEAVALIAFEQFEIAIDSVCGACGFGGFCIGGIGVAQLALRAFGPDRPRRDGGEVAQQLSLLQQCLVAQVRFRQFTANPAEFANPDNGLAADRAPHGLQRAPVGRRHIEQKTFAGLAERIDSMIHLQRRLGRQPRSEGKDALRLFRLRRNQQGGVTADFGPVLARRPRDQNLRLGEQQRPEAISLGLQLPDLDAQPCLARCGTDTGAHQQDCGHDREAEQRQRAG